MIQPARVQTLNDAPPDPAGEYVLYWMQAAQRARCNPALEHAAREADRLGLPLLACFGLTDGYPEANERHYAFMLEGLRDATRDLADRGVKLVVKRGGPPDVAIHYAKRSAVVVTDRGYMRLQKQWRAAVAEGAGRAVVQVEGEVVVPVEVAADKHQVGARTLRPRVRKHWPEYLVPLEERGPKGSSLDLDASGDLDVTDPVAALAALDVDRSVKPSLRFAGGSRAAGERLDRFVAEHLPGYADERNEPSSGWHSYLSAYLHFGQVSPLDIALRVRDSGAPEGDRDAYLEELLVRRELSMNYVHYRPDDYDRYEGLPEWARESLAERAGDERPHLYSLAELENARTHDAYWNAAQREMVATGFMQNYMRMFWGKKILEWSPDPRTAYDRVLLLNNKYFLCGRDPNSYTNVSWVFGLHDRPWGPRRPVFNTVRYMNAKGLDRKFDMPAYVEQVDDLWREAGGEAEGLF